MNVGICGISGRMGISILKILLEKKYTLSCAFDSPSSPYFGKKAGTVLNIDSIDTAISSISDKALAPCDGIIDFSSPAATMTLLQNMQNNPKPLVIGTTGINDEQLANIETASRNMPILLSANMSLGINLLFKLTEIAAGALSTDYDVEICEAHHKHKKDSPSGTAKRLITAVQNNMRGLQDSQLLHGREGDTLTRTKQEIGVHAIRGGDIVGDHTVFFIGEGERLELTHRATDRSILAKGAVTALEFLIKQKPGLYSMFDVFGL